ncbi:MAG: sulfite exporter TauE/SafE family protein [Proteobacteria bacterium]|nr:sulfite exporter TauE/SafE family protein [Pseudomonadota bacterium]MBU1640885.1 sulfite exporter TauE/SafE family protein [Pseudomonadota bacterium]
MLNQTVLDFPILLLPLVSFVISFFTSMAGVSGAFLLLPFQVSILGFTTPSVSATNFLYNIIGCPGGIWRFIREQRMLWPLAWLISLTSLPGILIGYYFRIRFFPDPSLFKLFVGCVLLYLGSRLLHTALQKKSKTVRQENSHFTITDIHYTPTHLSFCFHGKTYHVAYVPLGAYCLFIGIIGGIYGIGGGALIVPFCVSVLGLPIYTVAGATLFGTFIASISGVFFYSFIVMGQGQTFPPHWLVGGLLGLGGLLGMNTGALVQKHMPEKNIKIILALIIFGVAGKYIIDFFL